MATVEITFTALPVHVRTARLIVTAVARRSGVDEALLDEVRLAVGEACSQAVEAQQRSRPDQPVRLLLSDDDARFEVVVTEGPAEPAEAADSKAASAAEDGAATPAGLGVLDRDRPADDPASGLGMAVIAGLADHVDFSPTAGGLRIRMSWPTADARQETR
jgi:serine/threonine-protein kinase RsbW